MSLIPVRSIQLSAFRCVSAFNFSVSAVSCQLWYAQLLISAFQLSVVSFPMPQPLKTALVTGITGQDGSYLAELLLDKGYAVHGLVRRTSNVVRSRIEHLTRDDKIYNRQLFLHDGDLSDDTTLRKVFREVQPDEVYHLAGQTHVGLSF